MIRRCVICGAEFSTPPSNNKTTCSKECSRARAAKIHMGKSNRWSEAARTSAREAAARTGNLKNGTAAALRLPEGQRGEQNREAKVWHLLSPEGVPETAINLLDWARRHAEDYFGLPPTDANAVKIASGIRQIKRSQEGKIIRNGRLVNVGSYKGWQLLGVEEKVRGQGLPLHAERAGA